MAIPDINLGVQAPREVELLPAKINDRFIAYVIDAAPFGAAYVGTLYMMVMKWHSAKYSVELDHRIGLMCAGAYFLYQLLGNAAGGTIGKRLMGLRIVRRDGERLGVVGAFMRTVGYALSTPLSWGFVLALFHPESRAFHDLISGSVVIEAEKKPAAESALLFVCAVLVLSVMYAAMIWSNLNRITEKDLMAVDKAKDGLKVLAQVEEVYKATHPMYAQSMDDLAVASGDPAQFKSAMDGLFQPYDFQIEAGNRGYRISGLAKDRRKTRVTVSGPPPALAE